MPPPVSGGYSYTPEYTEGGEQKTECAGIEGFVMLNQAPARPRAKKTTYMTPEGHFRTKIGFALATRSRKRAPAAIFLWASLIHFEFAASFILPIQAFDGRVPFCDIAHRNEPKTARLSGFAIRDQFDFSNRAEGLKEFPQ